MKNLLLFAVCFLGIYYGLSAEFNKLESKVNYYKNHYNVDCLNEKITDNFGDGFDSLYGTRNMRTILFGIAYRGGANNFYNKHEKRDNHNPLPLEGLINLANEGFSESIYLYPKNFQESQKVITGKKSEQLKYFQISGNSQSEIRNILLKVKSVIDEPEKGPIYFHCWNGWHQSGYVSAAILMQFCSFTNKQAIEYWIENTDGVNKGYENVKNKIRNFNIFDDIKIAEDIKKLICPCKSSKGK